MHCLIVRFARSLLLMFVLIGVCSADPPVVDAVPARSQPDTSQDPWMTIFDGRSLDGWTPDGDATWSTANGVLVARGGRGHLYYQLDKPPLRDFELRADFALEPYGNSGVYVRSARAKPHPSGYEIQILGSAITDKYMTGSVWGRVRAGGPSGLSGYDRWNNLHIIVKGGQIQARVNGTITAQLFDEEHSQGHVALQHWTPDRAVFFKNLQLRVLRPCRTEATTGSPREPLVAAESPAAPGNREAASGADVVSQAIALFHGTDGHVDQTRAERLFEQAAREGNPLAKMWLAYLYFQGAGTYAWDETRGQEIARTVAPQVERLAQQGDRSAMVLWGYALEKGLGTTQRPPEDAAVWYQKAVHLGDPVAPIRLASTLLASEPRRAAELCHNSAKAGCIRAMELLCIMYNTGTGVQKDEQAAFDWALKAAQAGSPEGMHLVGCAYTEGVGPEKSDEKAVPWFVKAAQLGHAHAMVMLGGNYHDGLGVKQDESESVKWWRTAAERGVPEAMGYLGTLYAKGESVKRDFAEALRWYRKAADKGDIDAVYAIGIMYYEGWGVKRDPAQARTWVQRAIDGGHERARLFLERIKAGDSTGERDIPPDSATAVPPVYPPPAPPAIGSWNYNTYGGAQSGAQQGRNR